MQASGGDVQLAMAGLAWPTQARITPLVFLWSKKHICTFLRCPSCAILRNEDRTKFYMTMEEATAFSKSDSIPPRARFGDYHLTVKGFKYGTSASRIRKVVDVFLDTLFGIDNPRPVKYKSHDVNGEERCLQLAFAVDDNYPDMNLDEALENFCWAFFDKECTGAHSLLSDFNIMGYFPSAERMKLAWYKALFTWLHHKPEQRLQKVEDCVNEINEKGEPSPLWTKAAVLSISLGVGFSLGKEQVTIGGNVFELRTINKETVNHADRILGMFAVKNESRSGSTAIAQQAKKGCETMMKCSKAAIDKMREHYDDEDSRRTAHSEVLQCLIRLFEVGSKTVTLCTQSTNCFLASRNASAISSLVGLREAAVHGFNAVAIAALIADAAGALPQPQWVTDPAGWEASLPAPPDFSDSWLNSASKSLGLVDKTPGEIRRAAYYTERSRIISNHKQEYQVKNALITQDKNELWWELVWRVILAVLVFFGLFIVNGRLAYTAELERKKWAAAAEYANASIRHAQICELYLKWVYLARPASTEGGTNGSHAPSAWFIRELEAQLRKHNASIPTEGDYSPPRIRIRLQQYGKALDDMRTKLGQCLGISVD